MQVSKHQRSSTRAPQQALVFTEALERRVLLTGLPAELDPRFGGDGVVVADIAGINGAANQAYAVAVQKDGKVLVAGTAGYQAGVNYNLYGFVARYNANGSLDDGSSLDSTPGDSFGTGGKVRTPIAGEDYNVIEGIVVQPDGKIVLAGNTGRYAGNVQRMLLMRLNANGTTDTTFAGGGQVIQSFGGSTNVQITKFISQPDGKLLAVGGRDNDWLVARFTAAGASDTSFSGDGYTTVDFGGTDLATGAAVDRQNRIVVTGGAKAQVDNRYLQGWVVRFGTAGPVDQSFGGNGFVNLNPRGTILPGDVSMLAGSRDEFVVAFGELRGADNTPSVAISFFRSADGVFSGATFVYDMSEVTDIEAFDSGDAYMTGLTYDGPESNVSNTSLRIQAVITNNTPFAKNTIFSEVGSFSRSMALAKAPDGKLVAAGYTTNSSNAKIVLARFYGIQPYPFGKASGNVYRDRNGNGLRDSGEPGIAGALVYNDRDNSGTNDANEAAEKTDANGNYTFIGLLEGPHHLRVQAASPYVQTAPAAAGSIIANVFEGGNASGNNFGLQSTLATYAGVVFSDLDGDGVRDTGEPGLGGAAVYIDSNLNGTFDPVPPNGVPGPSETLVASGADGSWRIPNQIAGQTVVIRAIGPLTRPSNGARTVTGLKDLDTVVGEFGFGSSPAPTGTGLSGNVFNDTDRDGVRDIENPTDPDLSGWTVWLDLNRNAVRDTAEPAITTDSSGNYVFNALTPGNYRVRQTLNSGWAPTTQEYLDVSVVANQIKPNIRFGNAVGALIDTPSSVVTGSWTPSTGVAGFYGTNYISDANTLKGSKSVRYNAALPSAGYYQVFARWTADTNRASNVPIDIASATRTRTVTVNQKLNGNTWVSLGTYQFNTSGGSVTIRNAGTDGYVIADAIRFVKVPTPSTVIKDAADTSGISVAGTWTTSTNGIQKLGANYLHDNNPTSKGGRSVKFTPTLPATGVYEIFGWWAADANRATNARYDVATTSGTQTLLINQRVSGGQWVSLGYFSLTAAAASVTIRNDGANGYVIADAVRFVRVS